jgi:hypothetical protein
MPRNAQDEMRDPMTPGAGLASRLRPLVAAAVLGPMAVALNISVAGIIYQGPLTAFIDRAIALTLIAGAVMGVWSALLFSYRGTIAQPQNTIAVILSMPAGGSRRRRPRRPRRACSRPSRRWWR